MKQKVTKRKKLPASKQFPRPSLERLKSHKNPLPEATIFEPKVSNRWVCYIETAEGKTIVPHYLVKKFQRPAVTKVITNAQLREIAISPNVNMLKTVKPRQEQLLSDDIVLTIYDPIKPNASQILTKLMTKDDRFKVRLAILDPVANVVEQWTYSGCKLTGLNFSELEWGKSADAATITASISVISSKLE